MVRDEACPAGPTARHQLQQCWRRIGVDQSGGDSDVANPELLEVQGRRLAVHTDVRNTPARTYETSGQLEGLRDADGLYRYVSAKTVGDRSDGRGRILPSAVDHHVGAELLGRVEAAVGEIDGDDVGRAVPRR